MRVFLLLGSPSPLYTLSEKEKKYLFKVLRFSVNDSFPAKDSSGSFYRAFLLDENTLALEKDAGAPGSPYTGAKADITMIIALLKGKKSETAIRMLTEIGVSRIILAETEFTVREKRRLDRFPLIIREAVQQSGSDIPEISGPLPFREALSLASGKILLFHQSERMNTLFVRDALSGYSGPVTALIGPEGGFSEKECVYAESVGAVPVLLKTNILRAETATVYAASVIQNFLA